MAQIIKMHMEPVEHIRSLYVFNNPNTEGLLKFMEYVERSRRVEKVEKALVYIGVIASFAAFAGSIYFSLLWMGFL